MSGSESRNYSLNEAVSTRHDSVPSTRFLGFRHSLSRFQALALVYRTRFQALGLSSTNRRVVADGETLDFVPDSSQIWNMNKPLEISLPEWKQIVNNYSIRNLWGLDDNETAESFASAVYGVKFLYQEAIPGYTGELYIIQPELLSGPPPVVLIRQGRKLTELTSWHRTHPSSMRRM